MPPGHDRGDFFFFVARDGTCEKAFLTQSQDFSLVSVGPISQNGSRSTNADIWAPTCSFSVAAHVFMLGIWLHPSYPHKLDGVYVTGLVPCVGVPLNYTVHFTRTNFEAWLTGAIWDQNYFIVNCFCKWGICTLYVHLSLNILQQFTAAKYGNIFFVRCGKTNVEEKSIFTGC